MREKLDLLEDKLESLAKNEKIALAVFIPLALFALLYFFYIADAIDQQSSNENRLRKTDHDLHKYSEKVVAHKIQAMKKQLLQAKSALVENKQKLTYLETELTKNNFLFLSQKDFTSFLSNLLSKSVKNNFLIDDINISKDDSDFIGKLKYKKVVNVKGSGEFLDTIKFIREVEESTMLMEIKNLNIETSGSTPQVSYEIKFYGVKR